MDNDIVDELVQDLIHNLGDSASEISEEMIREMVILVREKQFESNQDGIVAGIKLILVNNGYSTKE